MIEIHKIEVPYVISKFEAHNTIKNQLNFGYQKDLKDELETFSWFIFSGPKD
jgi:hypothetical protein